MKYFSGKLRNGLAAAALLAFITASAGCGVMGQLYDDDSDPNPSVKTPYEQRKDDDSLYGSPSRERFADGVGIAAAEVLYYGIGSGQLDLLLYGAGESNMITLVNMIPDMNKLITMIGSDYPVGSETGLGAARTVKLLNRVDYWMQQNTYTGTLPSSNDTIQRLADFINGMPAVDIEAKVVGLVNSMNITRNLGDTNPDPETDETRIDRLAKLIAHSGNVSKILTVMNSLSAPEIIGKMSDLMLGLQLSEIDHLVESLDFVTDAADMVALIQGVTDMNKIVAVMSAMNPRCASKLAYIIDNVNSISTLTYLMNSIVNVGRMADLINKMEDATTWIDQIGGAQNWNASFAPSGANSGIVRLVTIMNGLAAAPNPAKLVRIIDNVADMTKMMRITQDVQVIQDMVDMIAGFADPGSNPVPVSNLAFVMNEVSLANIVRMRQLVDGQRIFGNIGTQSVYIGKLVQLVTALDNAKEGPLKVAELVDGVSNMDKMIDLTYDVSVLANLANVINDVNKGSSPYPDNTAVITLIYMVEQIADISKMVAVIDNVTPANVASLVNNVAAGSQWSDAQPVHTQTNVDDTQAAGKKLNNVISGTTVIGNLIFVMNNVSDFGNMADLVNALSIASTPKMATLVNGITGANAWNAGTPSAATGQGKVVNMIDNITDLGAVATLIDDITNAAKLYGLINQVTNSSLMVSLVNAVIADANTVNVTISDMVSMMNGIAVADLPKLSSLVTCLNGARDQLVADLLAPVSGRAQGTGYANMVTLMSSLNSTDTAPADGIIDSAADLAAVMTGLNPNLIYLNGTVSMREGMVRLIVPTVTEGGVLYLGQNFPGIGPVHLAVMMNRADDPSDLVALMNAIGLDNMIPMIGCGDAVGDPGHDGIGPFSPDFYTPCSAIGLGW
jgi:hypothetical protein